MRKLLLILSVLFCFIASAQKIQYVNTYGYEYQRLIADTLLGLPKDTFAVPASLRTVPFLANKSGSIYKWNISTFVWDLFSSYTDADARAAISLTTSGTLGVLAYNSSTGVFNYGGPQNLQSVTDVGNITTNDLIVGNTAQTPLATLFNFDNAGAITLRATDSSFYSYIRQAGPLTAVQYWFLPVGTGNDTLVSQYNLRNNTNSIQNQTASAQTANFYISGEGRAGTLKSNDVYSASGLGRVRLDRASGTYISHYLGGETQRSIVLTKSANTAFLQAITDGGTSWDKLVVNTFGGTAAPVEIRIGNSSTSVIHLSAAGNALVGTTTETTTAKLKVESTTQGFLAPRMTTTQRDAIASPATLLQISNTTTNTNDTYDGTIWTSSAKILKASATLDFTSTAAQTSSELTITATGAAVGDAVIVGTDVNDNNSSWSARVSSTNTVSVRFNNYSSAAIDPASGTFNVKVFKN